MSVLQRFVTDPDTAARMFPPGYGGGFYGPASPAAPEVTFLVGPIDCSECDGEGVIDTDCEVRTQEDPCADCSTCSDCDGEGYPARIEIVSGAGECAKQSAHDLVRCDRPSGAFCLADVPCMDRSPLTVHGVVALGKPILIVEATEDGVCPETEHVCIYRARIGGEEVDQVTYYDGDGMEDDITDRLSGPVKPGDTVHPIEVVT